MLTIGKTLDFVTGRKTGKMFRSLGMLLAMTFLLMPVSPTMGQGILRQRNAGDGRQNSQNAKNAESAKTGNDSVSIPWNSLDEQSRKQVREVVDGKTFVRHMPQQVGYCDPGLYDFLVSHPDVVIELWELLGVTQISLKETGPDQYLLKEGTATTSRVEVLYKSKNLCIVYALGEYEAPLMPRKIKGDVVLVLKSRYGRDKEDRPVVQSDLDAYVRIHNPGAEMLAKVMIPVVGKIADSNFEQTVGFVMNLSEAAQEDFEPFQDYARRMRNVRPEVAEEFAVVTEAVFDREVDRYVAQAAARQKTIGELAMPSSHSAEEAAPMPKYALRADNELNAQEQAFTRPETRMAFSPAQAIEVTNDNSRLLEPETSPEDFDARLVPPRTLTITNDHRTIDTSAPTTNDRPNPNARTIAPAPAFYDSSREIKPHANAVPPQAAPMQTVPTNAANVSNPPASQGSDRVIIRTIAPVPASPVLRSSVSQQAPTPGNAAQPSATRFGTTSPVAPSQPDTLRSRPGGNLPMPSLTQ